MVPSKYVNQLLQSLKVKCSSDCGENFDFTNVKSKQIHETKCLGKSKQFFPSKSDVTLTEISRDIEDATLHVNLIYLFQTVTFQIL